MKKLWNSVDGLGKGSLIALVFIFLGYLAIFIKEVIL